MAGPILPAGISARQFDLATAEFAKVIGPEWVLTSDTDRDSYADFFSFDGTKHLAAGALGPITTEEVRELVRIAGKHRIPLWPISRGKNLGYGAAAPLLSGSMVLDLSRMKKIEVDVEHATALIEPGVGFYDLYDHLQQNNIPLWLSVPGNSWGSVAGNALDRGVGYTTYGDHTSRICGMEVVLADGDLVRTGMGAMSHAPTWQLYRYGFGPAWDQMFVQSNFGVVTKLGLWLMPEPESLRGFDMEFDKPEDLEWLVDVVAPLRRSGTLQQSPSIGNWLRAAAALTTRKDWYDKPGALPDSVIDAIRKHFNIGWWSINMRFYGDAEVTAACEKVALKAFAGRPVLSQKNANWTRGQPREQSAWAGVPLTFALQNANWHGGRGGHIGYSPVLPPNGRLALEQFHRTYSRYQEFGMDYHGSFAFGERHLTNVNQVLFDKDNAEMLGRVQKFFHSLVNDATARHYGEYRTHIEFMDLVAGTYDFNHQALRRLNERVKNALDPHGILAPGKSGIWPTAYAAEREHA
jgi:4-cresol dehydrogenase (hydroxylating) flavoprotein subunit